MSIDYDRLREKLDAAAPGPWWFRDFSGAEHPSWDVATEDGSWVVEDSDPNNGPLIALAPDLARELLRLRRELTDLRDLMWTNAGHLRKDGHAIAADWTENHALRLAQIMQGDTE